MIQSIINTLQIVVIIPLFGMILGALESGLTHFLVKGLGVKATMFIMNRLTFIGVVHHELAHALLALLSGAKIKTVNLFAPKGNTLGTVEILPRGNFIFKSIQLALTAIAPVLMGIISLCIIVNIVGHSYSNMPIWLIVTAAYVFISILVHSTMSTADLKCALRGLPVCAVLIFIIVHITKFNLIKYIGGILK